MQPRPDADHEADQFTDHAACQAMQRRVCGGAERRRPGVPAEIFRCLMIARMAIVVVSFYTIHGACLHVDAAVEEVRGVRHSRQFYA